ncbi:hypothetical protein ABZ234_26600 [Nocardiopsis sp. NPDC006198]|uniref:hypothetical protein n=1 Tax=Nocardiopsis sp. NPDC006198 TaxID=3154472 RepID=UPI0033B8F51F
MVADRRGRVEGGGSGELQRVGDIRAFRTGRTVVRERIVGLEADRRFVYEALDGPFRSYRGTVELRHVVGGLRTETAVLRPLLAVVT